MENNEKDFTQVEEYNQQGRVLYSMDKYEDAISYYLKAEKDDPTYIQTYFNLTESYVMLDRFDEAKKALKRAQLIDKNNGEIYFHLGNIALLEECIDEGKQYYANHRWLEITRRNQKIRHCLGGCVFCCKDNQKFCKRRQWTNSGDKVYKNH